MISDEQLSRIIDSVGHGASQDEPESTESEERWEIAEKVRSQMEAKMWELARKAWEMSAKRILWEEGKDDDDEEDPLTFKEWRAKMIEEMKR